MGAMAMAGPVTMAVLGAGARGNVFAGFAEQFPGRARVVAVADPRADRRDALADRLGVAADRRLGDWRDLAVSERLADAVIVTTPDREHAEAAIRFAGLGYHVLLEKPIAPTWAECVDVVEAAEKAGVILAVCHVMRYTAYTETVKQVVAEGRLGQIVGVEHLEPVGWWHFAHAYVRGNWRRADQAGPSLLTKCCHDLDWLRYVVGRPAVALSGRGGVAHFTAARPPPRWSRAVVDDPKRKTWPLSVLTTDLAEQGVRRALREWPYGRCVYACDNDVADHQVVTIEFDGGVTATLTMSAFTPYGRRRTRIMGARGFLEGDGPQITVTDFVTGEATPVPVDDSAAVAGGGHGGGDFGVIGAFADAVASGDRPLISPGPRASLDSHQMAFAAERSRLTGAPVPLT